MTTDAELAARINSLKQSRSAQSEKGSSQAKRGRRHPARKSRVAAALLSIASTAGLSTAFFFMDASAQTQAAFSALPAAIETGRPTTIVIASVAAPVPIEVEAFNGERIDTRYGPVQVQVQIRRGTGAIADVAAVQFPDGDSTSRRISAESLPQLRSSALTAQSAEVHAVSGATYTTRAYKASLQSAIDAARSEPAASR